MNMKDSRCDLKTEMNGLITTESEINNKFGNVVASIGYSEEEKDTIQKKISFDKKIYTIVSLQKDSEKRKNISFYTNLLNKHESMICLEFLRHSLGFRTKMPEKNDIELYNYFIENDGENIIIDRLNSRNREFLNYLVGFITFLIEFYKFEIKVLEKLYKIRNLISTDLFNKFINQTKEIEPFFINYNIVNGKHPGCLCGTMLKNIITEIFSMSVIGKELKFIKKLFDKKTQETCININCIIHVNEIKIIQSKFKEEKDYDEFLSLIITYVSKNNVYDFNSTFISKNDVYDIGNKIEVNDINNKKESYKLYDKVISGEICDFKENEKYCPKKIYTERLYDDKKQILESKLKNEMVLKINEATEKYNLLNKTYFEIKKENSELKSKINEMENLIEKIKNEKQDNKNIIESDKSIIKEDIMEQKSVNKIKNYVTEEKSVNIVKEDITEKKSVNIVKENVTEKKPGKFSGFRKFGAKNKEIKESKFKEKNYIGLKWKKANSVTNSIFEKINYLDFEKNFTFEDFESFSALNTEKQTKIVNTNVTSCLQPACLEAKKSYALNIAMGRIKIGNKAIIKSILNKTFNNENLINQILMYFPTEEELCAIRNAKNLMGRAEKFFKEVNDGKVFYCAVYQLKFTNHLKKQDYDQIIFSFKSLYERIYQSQELVRLFSAFMVVGNTLNINKFSGKARGFEFDSIPEFSNDKILKIIAEKINCTKLCDELQLEKNKPIITIETFKEEIAELKSMFNEELFDNNMCEEFNNLMQKYNEMTELYQKLKKYFLAECDSFVSKLEEYIEKLKNANK